MEEALKASQEEKSPETDSLSPPAEEEEEEDEDEPKITGKIERSTLPGAISSDESKPEERNVFTVFERYSKSSRETTVNRQGFPWKQRSPCLIADFLANLNF